jgi:hypothetical protein
LGVTGYVEFVKEEDTASQSPPVAEHHWSPFLMLMDALSESRRITMVESEVITIQTEARKYIHQYG